MPDGTFEPHRELARINTLQELMSECRARTPKIISLIDDMLDDAELDPYLKLRVMEFVTNRAFGKPRQHVVINETGQGDRSINPVKIYIPDNGRSNVPPGPIIDADGEDN
jgi:hypothetical protein